MCLVSGEVRSFRRTVVERLGGWCRKYALSAGEARWLDRRGFAGVLAARAQQAVVGGRLFVASETGAVYALDAKTGCTYWTFRAQAGVRTAATVGPYKGPSGATRYAVYFGDGRANAYAVDVDTGQ